MYTKDLAFNKLLVHLAEAPAVCLQRGKTPPTCVLFMILNNLIMRLQ